MTVIDTHCRRLTGIGVALAILDAEIDARDLDERHRAIAREALTWALDQAAAEHILTLDNATRDPLDYRGMEAAA